MCGICGTFALDGLLDPRFKIAIRPMTDALAHRGPDGEGFHVDNVIALGHRRLAIIDRLGGAQPMTNEDGSCWIVFNGEIYNHRSLRDRLVHRGHTFRTTSDTETILHSYEEFGPDCVEHLDGMFAFAVYDAKRRELLLARDRIGKKPLFYTVQHGVIQFASEVSALRHSPIWKGEVDLSGLEAYLSLGYFLAPATIYRHVRQLEPGRTLRVRAGDIEIRKYWDIEEFDTDDRSEAELMPELQELVRRTVTDRLESEVPLGAFLSGGIDSGLVVSFMTQASAHPVTTTMGFGDGAYDETEAAGLTARHLGTDHHCEVVQPDAASVLDRVVASLDQPFADASAVPTYYVSALARRHVTVALTGDGGDETFGGYAARYRPHGAEAVLRPWLGRPGRYAAGWLGEQWPSSRQLPRWLRMGSVLDNLSRDPASAYYSDLCLVKPFQARSLLGLCPSKDPRLSPVYDEVTAPYRHCGSTSAVQKALYADLKVYLANDVLVKVDRMSMAHGLEVRCPLLDHRLVEFAFRIPCARKMPNLRSKHLLRQLAKRHLPAAIVKLPKRGFSPPLTAWLAGSCKSMFVEEVFARASFVRGNLDTGFVRRLFNAQACGEADHSAALWAVWMLERWSRQFGTASEANQATTKTESRLQPATIPQLVHMLP